MTAPIHLSDDQALRLECLRICSNTAEAKAAYFWINGEGRGQQAANPQPLAGGMNQANPFVGNAYNNPRNQQPAQVPPGSPDKTRC